MHRLDTRPFEEIDPRRRERVLALARALSGEGEARLGLGKAVPRRFARLHRAAGRMDCGEDEALRRLAEAGPRLLSRMREAAGEAPLRLPAQDGTPRLLVLLRALLVGEPTLTEEGLIAALHAFDEAQPLTMAELWAVKRAGRVALLGEIERAAAEAVGGMDACTRAARWVRRPVGSLKGADAAFLSHALKLAEEEGLPEARRRLEAHLHARGVLPEDVVRRAHDERARVRVRLEELLGALDALEELDGEAVFLRLSRAERALWEDPSGVYGAMDGDSRATVRSRLATLARALRLEETTLARQAVAAAREEDGEGATVCWWLASDEGRRALAARLGREDSRIPRIVPDPTGNRFSAALCVAALALAVLFGVVMYHPVACLTALPLGWFAGTALAGRIAPIFIKPNRLLKLELEHIPDDLRTLVVIPALLSCPERVEAVCDQLETMGSVEADDNLAFLLLGDFADGPAEHAEGDGEIVAAARRRVRAMNAAAGRERCFYLHRPRRLLAADGRWMGRDRKRGALEDLNRLLLGKDGAEAAFSVEGAACASLRSGYTLVLTLDADTRLLPGTIHALAGTMAHPMNRRCSVLQPAMVTLPSARADGYAALMAGRGGVSAYPVSVSNLWQDVTGAGLYGGKGIYRVREFHDALAGALAEGRILSHDLIEGTLAGTGFVDDVCLYDGFPATPGAARRRQHRWTRGDWQLLPLLIRGRAGNGAKLDFPARLRLADNLLRSMKAPALLLTLLAGLWTGGAGTILLALALAFLEPALHPTDKSAWERALAELSTLPQEAAAMLDAALRTLWRLYVSGRHLMDWTTAADSEGLAEGALLPGALGLMLTLPGILNPEARLGALGVGLLFAVGPAWMKGLSEEDKTGGKALSPADRGEFARLARATWRFFEENVRPDACPLPPDNVQLDPPVGAARRTSPTNIGLYLVSCLAAARLGFIESEELTARMDAAVSAMERMEKWRGHLYNWIDLNELAPLPPRYVSSVDSGNLAACLMLCANAPEVEASLAERMEGLAEGMDFAALYNERRRLFAIGVEAETGRVSSSHYDLLASEARILSFTALLLGQVPLKHWRALGRACTRVEDTPALLSWSGTMFEYLLPELIMPAPAQSLLGVSVRGAIQAQRSLGRKLGRPWGVSESGCYAFDGQLNYQYQAYGLPALALSGSASTGVAAPYACALAASIEPAAVAENIRAMARLGWTDEWGLYEAADYLRGGESAPALVKSHMAHHQGMILCALCNALTDDSLARDFMARPRARALSLLLEEEPPTRSTRRSDMTVRESRTQTRPTGWRSQPERRVAETHLLAGAGATALVTMDGAAHYFRDGILATRFDGDLLNRKDAACLHVRDEDAGADHVVAGKGRMLPGAAVFRDEIGAVTAELTLCLSPEDGTLVKRLVLKNTGRRRVRLTASDIAPVALADKAALNAHAVFQNMFVEGGQIAPNALAFRRRPREEGEVFPILVHAAWGGLVEMETDYDRLAGRMRDPGAAGGIARDWHGANGGLNPVSALRVFASLGPGEEKTICFCLCLAEAGTEEDWLSRWAEPGRWARAIRLARARAEAELRFLNLDAGRHRLLMGLAALLLDGHLAADARPSAAQPAAPREALWSLGLSGDRPILTLLARTEGCADTVRALLRTHAFYRGLGVLCDLALVNDGPAGYDRPVRDALSSLLDGSALRGRRGEAGGVWLIDGAAMSEEQRRALLRSSSACFDGERELYAQIRALLGQLEVPSAEKAKPLPVGASTLALPDFANGYGAFDGAGGYAIAVLPGRTTPAPWCDILANDLGGALLTERGGGFLWHGSSRDGRLTRCGNDSLREGWGITLWLRDPAAGAGLRLLPGDRPMLPFLVRYDENAACYAFEAEKLGGEVAFTLGGDGSLMMAVTLENRGGTRAEWTLLACVDWLMGTDAADDVRLNAWQEGGACLATGTMAGVGVLCADAPDAMPAGRRTALLGRGGMMFPRDIPGEPGGHGLRVPVRLAAGEKRTYRLAVAWAEDIDAARRMVEDIKKGILPEPAREPEPVLTVETPDEGLNALFNRWLLHQTRASRVLGRTGFYQPGGAYGFRDQLQDMLALIPEEPGRVRAHILRCAARQFEAGDVLHWWHEPRRGVRTRVSDDMLFLPFVTWAYVTRTGDEGILREQIPWLKDAPIPEGRQDYYAEMEPTAHADSLHEHCMRAFRRAANMGAHGLLKMGAGDWNDGMNRVGAAGKGESVWLSEFAVYCMERYLDLVTDAGERRWLEAQAVALRVALEQHGWDGAWYLRAYDDAGNRLGGRECRECRIDAISQAWAVLAGLDERRCASALDAAWEALVDEEVGIVKLLTPPFEGQRRDPGYIAAYPPGIRENGGQYTHGALWLLLAMIRRGDGARAHSMLQMLLPFNHAQTPEDAARYRVEPYVMAADVSVAPDCPGRGGWTWYTGAAAWTRVCVLALLGYERRGDKVRICPLMGEWKQVALNIRCGKALYRLVSDGEAREITLDGKRVHDEWIQLVDDGKEHVGRFPGR